MDETDTEYVPQTLDMMKYKMHIHVFPPFFPRFSHYISGANENPVDVNRFFVVPLVIQSQVSILPILTLIKFMNGHPIIPS